MVRNMYLIAVAMGIMTTATNAHETELSDSSCLRYIANEGVMISSGDAKVLFDAFYEDSYGQYALVREQTRAALMDGTPPYDDIDALFVSHVHGDHFSAAPTLEFLQKNPAVSLFASAQVITALKKEDGADDISDRLKAFSLAAGDPPQELGFGPIDIDVVRIPHAGGPGRADIENLAFRVTLDKAYTVLHMGDADPADRHFAPHQSHWDAKPLDMALPPYWFFANDVGRSIVDDRLKAKDAIGIHVPIAAASEGDRWEIRYGAALFTEPGETKEITNGGCAL